MYAFRCVSWSSISASDRLPHPLPVARGVTWRAGATPVSQVRGPKSVDIGTALQGVVHQFGPTTALRRGFDNGQREGGHTQVVDHDDVDRCQVAAPDASSRVAPAVAVARRRHFDHCGRELC